MISESRKIEELNKVMKRITDLEAKGALDKAIDEMEKARRAFPEDGNLLNHLGDLYVRAGKVKEAVEAYELGVTAYAKDTFFRNAIGLGKKVLRHSPEHVEMHRIVGDLLVELGQRADAAGYFLSYLEKLEKTGRMNDAVDVCRRALSMGMSDPALLKKIDEIYLAAGLKERKKIDVREVIKLKEPVVQTEKLFEERTIDLAAAKTEKAIQTKEEKPVVPEAKEKEAVRVSKEAVSSAELAAAVEKTIVAFSETQKGILNLLQGSLERHIGNLAHTVEELRTATHSNLKDSEKIVMALAEAMTSFAQKQETNLRNLSESVKISNEKLAHSIEGGTDSLATETRRYSMDTKEAYHELTAKFEDLNKTTGVVVHEVGESKTAISRLENFLINYVLGHDNEMKKNRNLIRLFLMIITSSVFVMVVLLLVLVLKK